jgi:hypothetical protein
MNGKFTHYLITRFNVPVKNWDRDKSGKTTLDQAWMQDRIKLFSTYCAPTIEHQSATRFTWLIYCDTKTSPDDLRAIQHIVAPLPMAEIHLVDNFEHLLESLKKKLSMATTPFVITSRVDNDDGLGKEYIHHIQSHFVSEDKTLLNLSGGISYDMTHRLLTASSLRLNHYGSLIEKNEGTADFITVMGFPHDQPPELVRVIDHPYKHAWLKIIHARNLKSRIAGVPVRKKNILTDYSL